MESLRRKERRPGCLQHRWRKRVREMREGITCCYICQSGDFRVRKGAVRDDSLLRVFECCGCGAGGFLRRARDVAAHAAGVEPERRVREYWGSAVMVPGNPAAIRCHADR